MCNLAIGVIMSFLILSKTIVHSRLFPIDINVVNELLILNIPECNHFLLCLLLKRQSIDLVFVEIDGEPADVLLSQVESSVVPERKEGGVVAGRVGGPGEDIVPAALLVASLYFQLEVNTVLTHDYIIIREGWMRF